MIDHTRIEKISGDSIIFVVIQVERETIMTAWWLYWEIKGLSHLIRYVFIFHVASHA